MINVVYALMLVISLIGLMVLIGIAVEMARDEWKARRP